MRVETAEIRWHFNMEEPTTISSVDFQLNGEGAPWRMATGGYDCTVKVWRVERGENTRLGVKFLASLNRHEKAVNVVRFSPNGQFLASGSDDGLIIIWRRHDTPAGFGQAVGNLVDAGDEGLETWMPYHTLKGHREDVYDLAWSVDSLRLLSGSIDNTAIVWNVATKKMEQTMKDHRHFVQGVAWSPKGDAIASQSSDRSLCVYRRDLKKKSFAFARVCSTKLYPSTSSEDIVAAPLNNVSSSSTKEKDLLLNTLKTDNEGLQTEQPETTISAPSSTNEKESSSSISSDKPGHPQGALTGKGDRLYVDEMKTPFFRRLSFSPDGKLLFSPAGRYTNPSNASAEVNTFFVYRADDPHKPLLRGVDSESTVVVIKPCPLLFEPRVPGKSLFKGLPYRMIYAVGTSDAVYLYDTEQALPFALVANVHYAPLTDLSWNGTGDILAISSQDGYCSFISFHPGELGVVSSIRPPLLNPSCLAPVPVVSANTQNMSPKKPDSPKEACSSNHPEESPAQPSSPVLFNHNNASISFSSDPSLSATKPKKRIAPMLISSLTQTPHEPTSPILNVSNDILNTEASSNTSPLKRKGSSEEVDPHSKSPKKELCDANDIPSSKSAPRRIAPTLLSTFSSN